MPFRKYIHIWKTKFSRTTSISLIIRRFIEQMLGRFYKISNIG